MTQRGGIVTVSCGDFRCRLEGFDEPLAALAAVAPWLATAPWREDGLGDPPPRGAPMGIRREIRNGALVLTPSGRDADAPEPGLRAAGGWGDGAPPEPGADLRAAGKKSSPGELATLVPAAPEATGATLRRGEEPADSRRSPNPLREGMADPVEDAGSVAPFGASRPVRPEWAGTPEAADLGRGTTASHEAPERSAGAEGAAAPRMVPLRPRRPVLPVGAGGSPGRSLAGSPGAPGPEAGSGACTSSPRAPLPPLRLLPAQRVEAPRAAPATPPLSGPVRPRRTVHREDAGAPRL